MKLKSLPIDSVRPYDNNPRKVNPDAIAAVKASIQQFGYNVPIVVDGSHVILTGHTRLRALQELGYTTVEVIVRKDLTAEQAREFRILDNRLAEMSEWDFDLLRDELRAVGGGEEMLEWFSQEEMDKLLTSLEQSDSGPTQDQIDSQAKSNGEHFANKGKTMQERMVRVTCAHCGEVFMADSKLAEAKK